VLHGAGVTESETGPAAEEPRKRRVGLIILIVVGVLALLTGGAFVGNNLIYDSTFDRLIAATETAERSQIWIDFFLMQDCFVTSVMEGNAEAALRDGEDLLGRSEQLAAHVGDSLAGFEGLSVQGFHSRLQAARDAIAAHYRVWAGHLDVVVPLLSSLQTNLEDFAVTFQLWVDAVVADGEPIEETFNAAETAFLDAARGGADLDDVDALFTPADITCTRGAV
jgi:hypothetical protein